MSVGEGNAMIAYGFFEDLPHGMSGGGRLADLPRDSLEASQRDAVAGYLRGAYTVAATSARSDDRLDPTQREVSAINVHTDGTYVWPEDLAYYVERYGVPVPADLLTRALAGPPSELAADQLDAVRAWLVDGSEAG